MPAIHAAFGQFMGLYHKTCEGPSAVIEVLCSSHTRTHDLDVAATQPNRFAIESGDSTVTE
jgi:hypothetical protein